MDGWNYFNYFTEIETYFWKKRGAHLLVSPLDWAIMETWQKAGVPLEAVLRGIDDAFESYQRSRRGAGKTPKSLVYCTDAVLEAAEAQLEAATGSAPRNGKARSREPFSREELRAYFAKNGAQIRTVIGKVEAGDRRFAEQLRGFAESLDAAATLLDSPGRLDVEDLERRLTVLDERLHAALMSHTSEDTLLEMRREMDAQLAAYRRKMKAEQLALVEKQYLQKRLLEEYGLPRLSLYYFS